MPKDNIERAIKKAQGGDLANYEAVRYEGYAPGGIAVIVEALTDNRNRTGGVVRSVFTKFNGNLGATGSVSHMFNHIGEISYKAGAGSAESVLEAAIDAGADDVQSDGNGHLITCCVRIPSARSRRRWKRNSARRRASRPCGNQIFRRSVDEDNAQTIMKMLAALEDDDDVQNVYANFEISDEVLKKLTAA